MADKYTIIKVELNISGFDELRNSPEIISYMEEIANRKAGSGSGNYQIKSGTGRKRAHVNISCADKKTYYKNLKTNDLIKRFS